MKRLFTLFLLFLVFKSNAQTPKGFSVSANQPAEVATGNTYAVVVGISDYKYVHPLNYATEDALLFYQFLRSKAGGNVPKGNIRLLTDEEATAGNIWIRGISWLQSLKPHKGDKIIFYFSGHGDAVDANESYFLAYDANPANDKNNYAVTGTLDIAKLKNRIRAFTTDSADVTLIIDACRTADLPGGKVGLKDAYESVIEQKAGELLLLSCSPNEVSLEDKRWGGGHGAFTWYLINGLAGKADADGDGRVSAYELQDYISHSVMKDTKTMGSVQTPTYCCNIFNSKIMSIVNNDFMNEVTKNEMAGSDKFSVQLVAARSSNDNFFFKDSLLRDEYFIIKKLCRRKNLIGKGSADSVYTSLLSKYKEEELKPLKDYLVSAMLDEAQEAVNAFITDKELSKNEAFDYYTIHSSILKRAIELIKVSHPEYVEALKPRLLYLESNVLNDTKYMRMMDNSSNVSGIGISDSIDSHSFKILPHLEDTLVYKMRQSLQSGYKTESSYFSMANLFDRLGRFDSALYYAKIAYRLAPNWINAIILLSDIYSPSVFSSGKDINNIEAKNLLKHGLNINNKDLRILTRLAAIYVDNEDTTEIYSKQVLKIDPNSYSAYEALINSYLKNDKCDSAYVYDKKYKRLKKNTNYPYGFDFFMNIAKCYLDKEDFKGLKNYSNENLESSSDWEGESYAYLYYDLHSCLHDSIAAKKLLNSISHLATEKKQLCYEHAAWIFKTRNEPDQALAFFLKSFQADSTGINSGNTETEIMELYESEKQFDKAYAFTKRANTIHPHSFKFKINLAKLAYLNGDSLTASRYLDTAISIGDESSDYFYQVASRYAFMKNINGTANYLKKAFDRNSTAKDFFSHISIKEFAILDGSDELKFFLDKYGTDTVKYLGDLYSSWDDYQRAIPFYKNQLITNDDGVMQYNLACCYSRVSDESNALVYLEKAINNGAVTYDWIQKDSDLTNIRTTPEFKALMKKYFPDKNK